MPQEETIQEITFQVPGDYTVPILFQSLSPKDTSFALSLGAQAYSLMTKEGQKLRHETLFKQLQAQASGEYEPRLETLQKQVTQSQEAISTLKRHLQEEEERRRQVEQKVREEERRNREELLQEKNSRISSLEIQLKIQLQTVEQSMRDNSRSIQESFQSFKESFLKTASGSKKKGEHGEQVFQEIAQRAFGSVPCGERFSLEAVGTEGHQGDIHMYWRNHKLLFEVKHYTRNVDEKEIKKFHRDMEQGKDMSIGVLVSLTTGIVGHSKAGSVDIEVLRDGRLCIYLSNLLDQQDPVDFLQSLKPFLETFLQLKDSQSTIPDTAGSEAEAKLERFETQRTMILKLLQHHQENTRIFKNNLQNAKKKQEQIWNDLSVDMLKAEHDIKLLLETLLDVHGSKDTTSDSTEQPLLLPSYIFYKTDLAMYNDKERKFLQILLDQFTCEEEASCTKKELKDVMKPMGYSDELVNKYCERFFLENVWEKGKKSFKCLRRRVDLSV
jgi:hypothetical protein